MRVSLIIAAGGSGTRFKPPLRKSPADKKHSKLFFTLAGRPVLSYCLSTFQTVPEIRETVIAAPRQAISDVQTLIKQNQWRNIKVVEGGATRAESVWKAFQKICSGNEWVMVHDGGRPFIQKEDLRKVFRESGASDGVLLARKVVPTLKHVAENGRVLRTVDRTFLYEAETPQLVRRKILKRAFETLPSAFQSTDEASMLEALKARVKIVPHEGWNPKITSWNDLELAEAYLQRNQGEVRTGFGRDTHRLVEGRKFLLGGVRIPFEKGPLGHSDGDALLHAICDAVLGATGAGDIGEWFSDRDPKFKNIPSARMLTAVFEDARKKGWRPGHLDTVIILEKPKLGSYKMKIKKNIAKLLGLPEDAVSIKAKTAEGLGPEGEGLAITCEALVSMRRE